MNTLIQTNAPAAAKPSVLCDGLIRLGFFCKEDVQELAKKLKIYDGELQLFNSVYDLTAAKTEHERALHIFDCLAAVGKLRELKEKIRCERTVDKNAAKTSDFTVADIGSGAGLPGIPLALAMSDTNFVLVERMSKRCVFLENCAAVLGLKNVRIVNTQLERLENAQFDIAVFRAFRPLDKKTLRFLLRILKNDGFLAAYKAKRKSIEEEMCGVLPAAHAYDVQPLSVPFLENRERHLVIVPAQAQKVPN